MIDSADPAGWSERRLRVLAALFATISEPAYEGESERHARLAAAALNEVAEPGDLRRLRLLLDLLEAPLGLPRLTGMHPFSRLPRQTREDLLQTWAASRIAQRRTFFHTIKRLAAFLAYADPGVEGGNPRWPEIGYELPEHDLPDPGLIAASLVRPADGQIDVDIEADVVVVGSGAAGGVAAARLGEQGHSVVVVESGPYVSEAEMPRNELEAFDRLYLDHGMTATEDLGLAILAGSALGGGTLINWATCLEPPPSLRLEWARTDGLEGFDGEATDSDLARLRDELGFCPPPSIGPKDQAILDGARALGWEAAPTERDADDCSDCGACGFGCPRGAKRSGQRLHLAAAARHGARLFPGAPVSRIDIEGGRAVGVSGEFGAGRRFSVRARSVVLAAGALRTPTMLAMSGVEHAQLGRNLHLHPTAAVAGRFDQEVLMWRGTMQGARSLELIEEGVLIESAPAHPGLIALAFPWEGSADQAELMRDVRHYAPLIGIVRDQDGGRVEVSRSGRTRISYRISDRDAARARRGLIGMARLARAAGARRLVALGTPAAWHEETGDKRAFERYLRRLASFDFGPNRGALFSAHQMGTVRAGGTARDYPCDPFGRVRGVRGLYVADASLFPTALGVNPMVTVMALAARAARTVHADARPAG